MYQDKTLVCKDCGAEFVFTAGEQEFYAEKGFQNEPSRCKACRQARKASRPANNGEPREMYELSLIHISSSSAKLNPSLLGSAVWLTVI